MDILRKVLDGCALRHQVLAENVANANTPGYVRRDVVFRDALVQAMDSGRQGAVGSVLPEIEADDTSTARADGNNVSMHKEMAALSENTLLYSAAASFMKSKFQTLHKSIGSR